MKEVVYQDDNVELSKNVFAYKNAKFAISHLVSIRLIENHKKFPFLLLILSILLIIAGLTIGDRFVILSFLGVLFVIISFVYYFLQKPIHRLVLHFSSNEKEVVESVDYKYLQNLGLKLEGVINS